MICFRAVITVENPIDPFMLRLAVGVFFLLVLLFSFLSSVVASIIADLYGIGVGLIAVWLAYLLWGNRFHQDYMAGYNILSVASVLLFEKPRHMLLFMITASLALILAVLFCDISSISILPFVGINIFCVPDRHLHCEFPCHDPHQA